MRRRLDLVRSRRRSVCDVRGQFYVYGWRKDRLHQNGQHSVSRRMRDGINVVCIGRRTLRDVRGIIYVRGRRKDRLHQNGQHGVHSLGRSTDRHRVQAGVMGMGAGRGGGGDDEVG